MSVTFTAFDEFRSVAKQSIKQTENPVESMFLNQCIPKRNYIYILIIKKSIFIKFVNFKIELFLIKN